MLRKLHKHHPVKTCLDYPEFDCCCQCHDVWDGGETQHPKAYVPHLLSLVDGGYAAVCCEVWEELVAKGLVAEDLTNG